MEIEVQHSLGHIECGNARFLVQPRQVHDELVHADLVIGHVEFSLQARHHVVGVQNSVLRGLGDTLLAEGQHVLFQLIQAF